MSLPTLREMTLALNTARSLPRGAACLLAGALSEWLDTEGAATRAAAHRVGVAPASLATALALRDEAPELAARAEAAAAAEGARLHSRFDADYPSELLHLSLPPPAIYCRGELPVAPAIAVVGSRRAESWALEAAHWLAEGIAAAGVTVVSGLARGVDEAAHRGALEAPLGRTVAVLGCGLGVDYPRGHRLLSDSIVDRGAVLTEFPPGTPPEPWRFPVRNRLIAALSSGVLVVSAIPRSGSLVTARLALELGREVMAVPARIFDETGLGTNALLRDGATLVRHPADALEAVGLAPPRSGPSRPVEPTPSAPSTSGPPLIALLRQRGPLDSDTLATLTGTAIEVLLGELLELELAGRLRRLPGPRFEALK